MRASLFSLASLVVGEEDASLLQTASVRRNILTLINGLQRNPSIEIKKYVSDAPAAEALIQRAAERSTSQTVAANFMALRVEDQERLIEFGRTSPEAHEVFAKLSPEARLAALLAVERHLDSAMLEKGTNNKAVKDKKNQKNDKEPTNEMVCHCGTEEVIDCNGVGVNGSSDKVLMSANPTCVSKDGVVNVTWQDVGGYSQDVHFMDYFASYCGANASQLADGSFQWATWYKLNSGATTGGSFQLNVSELAEGVECEFRFFTSLTGQTCPEVAGQACPEVTGRACPEVTGQACPKLRIGTSNIIHVDVSNETSN